VVLLATASPLQGARGQDTRTATRIADVLSAPAAARFATSDTLTRFRTQPVPEGRFDLDAGVYRAVYRIQESAPAAPVDAESAARAYLSRHANAFGLEPSLSDLALVDRRESESASHLTFQQRLRGVPVYGRQIRVNLDRRFAPSSVSSGYAPELKGSDLDVSPRRTPEEIVAMARSFLRGDLARHTAPERVVVPGPTPRLAWRLVAWSEDNYGEWELVMADATGEPVQIRDLSTHGRPVLPASPRPAPAGTHKASSALPIGQVDGLGLVFDPDPLSTSGQFYASPLVDADDQDVAPLNAERIRVDLPELTAFDDGLIRLEGPHVRIVPQGPSGNDVYVPPAEARPDGFQYGRADDAFEAVNAYYHVDRSQRYVQSLSVGRPIQAQSIAVNPHGLGNEDNSRYYPTLNYIAFGAGGVDDAEDAFVIWHEYGHSLLQASAPGLLDSAEGRALHEGWADYWAASYARFLAESGAIARSDWQRFFKWDSGDGEIWAGRELTFQGMYPIATACDDRPTTCNIYSDGMLWAVTQMSIYDALGRHVTDRLNLQSHAYLLHPVTFRDAAEAVIQADIDLYGGAHIDLLFDRFDQRGLIDRSTFPPLTRHTPPTWVEALGGVLPISVEATGVSAEIDQVVVRYGYDGTLSRQLPLSPSAGTLFTGDLPLPIEPGLVTYAVEATDKNGLMTRLPSLASETRYSFAVGPDTEAPTVDHNPLGVLALADWPPAVVASAHDNLGVDTVTVAFRVVDPTGHVIADSAFGLALAEGTYSGTFPVAASRLSPASGIAYRLFARDRSVAANTAVLPSDGEFTFSIAADGGLLRYYDFESIVDDLQADGAWAQAEPTYGTTFAFSGEKVWGTAPAGPYPAVAGLSSLRLPPLRVATAGDTYLVFWHYVDTEHDEASPSPILWDGGNVKVSTDGGAGWTILHPVGGYDGVVAAGRRNPLGGQPAFGGYSYGWQRALFSLPLADEVLVRFDFGTDDGNDRPARGYAGWYLDDLSIQGEPPYDETPPQADVLPPARQVLSPGLELPDLYLEANDDTGVRAATVRYTYHASGNPLAGEVRLAMSPLNRYVFGAPFATEGWPAPQVGDSLFFEVVLEDHDGNVVTYPADGEPAFRIEFRLQAARELLADAVGTGVWAAADGVWEIRPFDASVPVSSLILGPIDLPDAVDDLSLVLLYEQHLGEGLAVNVKHSADGGTRWDLFAPVDGYDAVFDQGAEHPMAGESVFIGDLPGTQQAVFDLVDRRGTQIWLRLDAATGRQLENGEAWRLRTASLRYSTLEPVAGGFDIPRTLALHPNYPDPFSESTTISYTLPEQGLVSLGLFDLLGRRRAVLVEATQPAGSYVLSFERNGLPSGLYLLRLETTGGSRTERLVIAR
jgi:hypothetical protein